MLVVGPERVPGGTVVRLEGTIDAGMLAMLADGLAKLTEDGWVVVDLSAVALARPMLWMRWCSGSVNGLMPTRCGWSATGSARGDYSAPPGWRCGCSHPWRRRSCPARCRHDRDLLPSRGRSRSPIEAASETSLMIEAAHDKEPSPTVASALEGAVYAIHDLVGVLRAEGSPIVADLGTVIQLDPRRRTATEAPGRDAMVVPPLQDPGRDPALVSARCGSERAGPGQRP